VLDPFAPATRRSSAVRRSELAALELDAPAEALSLLLNASERPVDLARFEVIYNLSTEYAARLYASAEVVELGKDSRVGITKSRYEEITRALLTALAEFHRTHPQSVAQETESVRRAIAPLMSAEAFASVVRTLVDGRKVEASGSSIRLAGHNATANAADDRIWQSVQPALDAAAFNAPPVRDLATQLKLKEAVLKDFLHRKAKTGEVLKVTAERFYTRGTVATLAAVAQATAQAQPAGLFTAAQYRDASGLGRSLAIEILEFLDTLGITQRIGDSRKMRKDFVPILGAAKAPPAPRPKTPTTSAAPPRRPVHTYRR
jgi:selenocysteine-specific elongation factor